MKIRELDELYVEALKDLYSAENQIIEALPKLEKAVEAEELKEAVRKHLDQTKGQVERLKTIFDDLGENPKGHHCEAMEGLLAEGDELAKDVVAGPVRDAALIGNSQKVEHYEIAGYGTARTFAQLLGHDKHIDLLQATLDEEFDTDEKLTSIAEKIVNEKAASIKTGAAAGAK